MSPLVKMVAGVASSSVVVLLTVQRLLKMAMPVKYLISVMTTICVAIKRKLPIAPAIIGWGSRRFNRYIVQLIARENIDAKIAEIKVALDGGDSIAGKISAFGLDSQAVK